MVKKVLIVSLALFGIMSSQLTICFADTEATKAQIVSLIEAGKLAEADTATNKLIADFNNSPGVDDAVHQIALKYQGIKNYQKTIELSRRVVTNWPQSQNAMWAQMDIVMANLYLRNESAAKTEISTLISHYKDNPDLPRMISIIGQEYRKEDFGQILKQNFNADSPAKVRLAILNVDILAKVESGDYRAAGQGADRIIVEFSSDADLPEMLLIIAQQLSWWHQYEQAGNLCQQIVQRYPDSPSAVKAKKCISKTGQISNIVSQLIASGDYGKVGKAVEELMDKFGDEEDTPSTIYDIAGKLESAGQYALAKQMYEQVIWRYPNGKFADFSRIAAKRTRVLALDESGDEAGAKSEFDGILNDFKGHSYLPANVMWTAEGYYRRACKAQDQGNKVLAKKLFDKTTKTLEVVTTQFSDSEEIPNACYLAGDCYRRMSEYQRSTEYFQRIVDTYPAYSRAGRALFMVGRNLEDMQTLGLASGPEINEAITAVYKRLIRDYPDCDTVKLAESWLNQHNAR